MYDVGRNEPHAAGVKHEVFLLPGLAVEHDPDDVGAVVAVGHDSDVGPRLDDGLLAVPHVVAAAHVGIGICASDARRGRTSVCCVALFSAKADARDWHARLRGTKSGLRA